MAGRGGPGPLREPRRPVAPPTFLQAGRNVRRGCSARCTPRDRSRSTRRPPRPRPAARPLRPGAGPADTAPRVRAARGARDPAARQQAGRGRPAGESPQPWRHSDAAEVVRSTRRTPGRAPPRRRERQPALPGPPERRGRRELPRGRQRALAGVAVRAAVPGRGRPPPSDHLGDGRPGRRLARAAPARRRWTSSAATCSTARRCAPCRPTCAGPDNDLADLLDHYVQRAIAEPDARRLRVRRALGAGDRSRTRSSASSPATASTTST